MAKESRLTVSNRDAVLGEVAERFGTPCYVYFLDGILKRVREVRDVFGDRFRLSFAVKSNPNSTLLRRLSSQVDALDVSSIGEVERGLLAGWDPSRFTFSGPAKRREELARAIEVGVGEVVAESEWEVGQIDQISRECHRVTTVLLRINPLRVPRHFGVNMSGKATQFGIDEEVVEEVIDRISQRTGIDLAGFHIYSATNGLVAEAVAENFTIFMDIFQRVSNHHDLTPRRLVFGAGFGIPYSKDQGSLDLEQAASLANPEIDALRSQPRFWKTELFLELGRYLVGREGYLLSRVIGTKDTRDVKIRLLDVGFNGHLAAWGMMGTVIRRNWPIHRVGSDDGRREAVTLTGPLCTTIDRLATDLELPILERGDVIAISSSGAYGLTASPLRFISQPVPSEILVDEDGTLIDISEEPAAAWERNGGAR